MAKRENAMATAPTGHCVCSHPDCTAHSGHCTAPETKAVNITYKGERKGSFRFCDPCKQAWKTLDDLDVQDVVPVIS